MALVYGKPFSHLIDMQTSANKLLIPVIAIQISSVTRNLEISAINYRYP